MKKTLRLILTALVLTLVSVPIVNAQCPEEYLVEVGTSQCIHVCAGQVVNISLQGTTFWASEIFSVCTGCFCLTYVSQDNSPEGVPTLVMVPGCLTGSCTEQCTAVVPPAQLVLGGDPFYPNDYYGESNCLFMYLHFVHYLSVDFNNDFTAVASDGQVSLSWSTASETNNARFDIMRNGETVGQVEAANLSTDHSYTWADRHVQNGTTYTYTLVSVDVNAGRAELATTEATPSFGTAVVTEYALHQNYPNPFNPETSIAFDLVQAGDVKLAIYNVLGEQVTTLVNGQLSSGRHSVVFNGANLTSGVYLYKLEVNGYANTKKLVLLK